MADKTPCDYLESQLQLQLRGATPANRKADQTPNKNSYSMVGCVKRIENKSYRHK